MEVKIIIASSFLWHKCIRITPTVEVEGKEALASQGTKGGLEPERSWGEPLRTFSDGNKSHMLSYSRNPHLGRHRWDRYP